MNYIEILLRLNKIKKMLFLIFVIFMISGYLMQKFNSKTYEFKFDIYFPSGSFLDFSQKREIYSNFQSSILTELVKKNYRIKKKPTLNNAYRISTLLTGDNSEDFVKKKQEVVTIFKLQKKNLIRLIANNYDITNITLKELPGVDEYLINSIKLELMWIELEREHVIENITEFNNINFPKELTLKNKKNYYAIMAFLFVTFLVLYISYIMITEDIKKKIKNIKKKI